MNPLTFQDELKKIGKYSVILFLMSATVCLMFELISPHIVTSAYNGTSLSILNNLVKYQSTKSVEHYMALADRIFYKYWIYFGVVFPILVMLSRFLNLRQTRGIESVKSEPEDADLSKSAIWKRGDIITIAILSLLTRAVFLPFVVNLPTAGDEITYWKFREFLVTGDPQLFLPTPLWGYIMVATSFVYNHTFTARILAVLIGSCAPVLVYLLAAKIFNRRTAVIAAILYVFFPSHVGYSHCLWAELFFGVLAILSTLFFFLFLENTKKKKYFLLCFIATGVALLAKEFSVILFAALFVAMFFCRMENKVKRILLAIVLFLVPVTVYSVAISCATKKVIILNNALILNFKIAAGIETQEEYVIGDRGGDVAVLLDTYRQRGFSGTIKKTVKEAGKLWSPQSYISTRLAGIEALKEWSYGVENPWPLIYLIAGYYVFLVLTAIPGICLARTDIFKIFSITCLCALTALGVLAFLLTRYRLPFMFIVVIFSANFLSNGLTLLGRKKRFVSIFSALVLIIIFIALVNSKMNVLHTWG